MYLCFANGNIEILVEWMTFGENEHWAAETAMMMMVVVVLVMRIAIIV